MDGKSLLHWDILKQKAPSRPLQKLSRHEVSRHNGVNDAWMILNGKVFDLTMFLQFHPGGIETLRPYLGKDGTAVFGTAYMFDSLCRRYSCLGKLRSPSRSFYGRLHHKLIL
jgi:cytochrome b involved in lipid metabolism